VQIAEIIFLVLLVVFVVLPLSVVAYFKFLDWAKPLDAMTYKPVSKKSAKHS
jgi:hypothetical protein